MLPYYYDYFNPVKIVSGHKALDSLSSELDALGVKRPMVITSQRVVDAGLIKLVKKSFADSNIIIGALFDDVPFNSSTSIVKVIAEISRKNRCDSVVAIGGETVVDTAKCANLLVSNDAKDLIQFVGADVLTGRQNPVVVVPSTSGTGSEISPVAGITDDERNIAMVFSSRFLLPDVVLLDPKMTLPLSAEITAAAGMDSLVRAMESYISLKKNPMSDAYAFAAVEMVHTYFLTAVQNPDDAVARLAMANASTMAGAAFANANAGMVHALGQAVRRVAGTSHGVATAILLPLGLAYNLSKCETDLGRLLLPMTGSEMYARTARAHRAQRLLACINELQRTLNDICSFPLTLKGAGVSKQQLEQIASMAVDDPTIITNPREMDRDDALEILGQAYE